MSGDILYFAYGSNMSTLRLRNRIAAQVVGTGMLPGYRLNFHKKWTCGSGKCDALHTGIVTDQVWGVVYAISPADIGTLDTIECKDIAYFRKTVNLTLSTGETCQPEIYVGRGEDLDPTALPFDWYKHHVQFGAKENDLPADYITRMIAPVPTITDPEPDRLQREFAIYPNQL